MDTWFQFLIKFIFGTLVLQFFKFMAKFSILSESYSAFLKPLVNIISRENNLYCRIFIATNQTIKTTIHLNTGKSEYIYCSI